MTSAEWNAAVEKATQFNNVLGNTISSRNRVLSLLMLYGRPDNAYNLTMR